MRIPAPRVPQIPKNRVLVHKQAIAAVAHVNDERRLRFVRFERFAQVVDMPLGQLF